MESENHPSSILPHQISAFETLSTMARVTFTVNRTQFPLSIRPNICIVGPSGVGKTHLARAIGEQMDIPTYYVNVSTWSVLGASHRGTGCTWHSILKFLETCMGKRGAIIIVDEIDKVGDSTSWTTYLRSELFDLLDWRIPRNLTDSDGDMIPDHRIRTAEYILRNKTMIVGIGAFQSFWENERKNGIGFVQPQDSQHRPDTKDLAKTLPTELSNRFGSNIISLPPLTRGDYLGILDSFLARMPDFWKARFEVVAKDGIDEAVRLNLGTRFFEESLLTTLMKERQEISNFQPEISKAVPGQTSRTPGTPEHSLL